LHLFLPDSDFTGNDDTIMENAFDVQQQLDDAFEGKCMNFTDSKKGYHHIMEWCHNQHFKQYKVGHSGDYELDEMLGISTLANTTVAWYYLSQSSEQQPSALWTMNPRAQQFFAPTNPGKHKEVHFRCHCSFNVTLVFECPAEGDHDSTTLYVQDQLRHQTMRTMYDCESMDSYVAVVPTPAACRGGASKPRTKSEQKEILRAFFDLIFTKTMEKLESMVSSDEQQSRLVKLLIQRIDASPTLPASFSMRSLLTTSRGAVELMEFRPDEWDAQELLELVLMEQATNMKSKSAEGVVLETVLIPLLQKSVDEKRTMSAYDNKTIPAFIVGTTASEDCLLEHFRAGSLLTTPREAAIEGDLMEFMEQVQLLSEEELQMAEKEAQSTPFDYNRYDRFSPQPPEQVDASESDEKQSAELM
jgi:hypothetical protein